LNKAIIYSNWGKHDEAVKEAERSIKLRGKTVPIGNETRMIASLYAAIQFSKKNEDEEELSYKKKYEDMITELEKVMLDKDKSSYLLRKRLSHELSSHNYSNLEKMEQEVMEFGEPEVIASYWISRVITKPNMPFLEKLELTEMAWTEASKPKVSTDLKTAICNLFASIYLETELDDKALQWYKESLTYNPFFWPSRQNYLALLWKNEKWVEAVEFLEEQRKRFGDLPSILFAYGKSLVEAGESGKALPILRLAQRKNPGVEYISNYIEKALDHWDGKLENVPDTPAIIFPSESVTIASLENCLKDFVRFIGNDKRMSFWKSDPKLKGHKWISSPEQHGQNLLHTFIKSRFGEIVEAIEEVDTGAGRIDIYLRFENGLKTIIELKMCGGGYSEGYAVSGI
jgi:tetratricopeptide (TPR) repeat protein